MKLLNLILIGCLLITNLACSTTKTVKIEKKPLISDHHLMMSMLNRPMTGDQKIMLAFARQQDSYQHQIAPVFVNAIYIRGEKSSDNEISPSQGIYSALIAQDINAIRIQGL
ncbi:hypothetical protein tinsulaeT_02540 [Thalassotalea insulae]|uniref:Uncharacterized protein n=1 Tax=Thalassotalea insulae TaxID=2056778 RepID=A0ABQ6GP21_9GAMM|nr:hypothetical protein [Thalassotalea insulae]GLX76914.1 hypothetical protein tinsulaeT_02540 [Thalassotalea insulae]